MALPIWRRFQILAAIGGLLIISAPKGHADYAPSIRDLKTYSISSPNGRCLAYVDAASEHVTGYRLEDNGKTELWVIPQYALVVDVADDCQSAIAIYRGGGMIYGPEHHPLTGVIFFFRSGKLLRKMALGELYPNIDALPRSVSHTIWLPNLKTVSGWENSKWFILTLSLPFSLPELSSGRKLMFDPVTGENAD